MDTLKQEDSFKRLFKSKKVLVIATVILVLCALLTAGIALVILKNRPNPTGTGGENSGNEYSEDNKPTPTETPTPTEKPGEKIYNGKNLIFFVRLANRDKYDDDELWVVNSDGTGAKSLNIKGVHEVFNGGNTEWVIFTKLSAPNTIFALNLADSSVKEIIEPNIGKIGTAYIQNNTTTSISPDESKVAYNLSFTNSETCGEGGCDAYDGYPDRKTGYYAYDLNTDKKVYLGTIGYITGWSIDSKHVFSSFNNTDYHEYKYEDKVVRVNVETGNYELIDTKPGVLSSINYFNGNKKLINTNVNSSTQLILNTNGVNKTIDSGAFADIQSVKWNGASKNHKYAVYQRNVGMVPPGHPINNLNIINLDNGTIQTFVTTGNNEITYDFGGWINDTSFYFLKAVNVDFANYNNTKLNQDIYIIDAATKNIKKLTNFGDVTLL